MDRTSRIAGLPVVVVLVLILGGCAFGTRQATLIYPPKSETGVTPVASAAAEATSKEVSIVLMPFNDQRPDKKLVGTVRNGFGMRTADVVAVNSVPEWVSQALKLDFQKNGYTVISGNPGDSKLSPSVIVSGDIDNVFCDAYLTYEGQMSLMVKVSKDGNELLSRQYMGTGTAGMSWGATADSYAQSLALALASAIKQLVSDLDKTLAAQ